MKWLITLVVVVSLSIANSIAVQPNDDLFKKGESAIEEKEYQQATNFFTDFLKSDTGNQSALYNLALSYYNLSNTSMCLENLQKIENWNQQEHILTLASWCAYSHEEKDTALHWLDYFPDGNKSAEMLMLKAMILKEKSPEESKVLLEQALLMAPGKLEILFYRSDVHLALKDTNEALKDLNVYLTHHQSAEAYAKRAEIKRLRNQINEAAKDYNEAYKIQHSVKWKYALLELFAEDGDFDEAIKIAEDIEAEFPVESEKVSAIQKRLTFLNWLNAFWLYGFLAVSLILILIYFLFFKS